MTCEKPRVPNRVPCALLLSYDGGAFRGWQRQPGMPTIQEAIEDALQQALRRKVLLFGAARTDAGVHAEGQVCHFVKEAVGSSASVESLAAGLREALPPSIELRAAALAHPSFHARSSAVGKRYRYRFSWGAPILPRLPLAMDSVVSQSLAPQPSASLLRTFQLGLSAAPDWERARAALRGLAGLEALPGLSSPSTDRRPAPPLGSWSLTEEAQSCALEVAGPAFRKHQVRNIAGHLAAVALGLAEPESLAALAVRTRPWMGACAPPQGLTLVQVEYPAALDPFAAR